MPRARKSLAIRRNLRKRKKLRFHRQVHMGAQRRSLLNWRGFTATPTACSCAMEFFIITNRLGEAKMSDPLNPSFWEPEDPGAMVEQSLANLRAMDFGIVEEMETTLMLVRHAWQPNISLKD